MKKFLFKYMIFILPIIGPILLLEMSVRNIPNDYRLKNEYMFSNSNSIETLILGNSHTYLGVNPTFIDSRSFNLAHNGETLEYNIKLFNKYKKNLQTLKVIVIPISYGSLFNTAIKKWIKNYNIYHNLKETDYLVDNLEVLNKNWIDLIEDNYLYYYLMKPSPYLKSNSLGWYEKMEDNVDDYNMVSKKAAKWHTADNFNQLPLNLDLLKEFFIECENRGIKIIIVTTPTHIAYRKELDKTQLSLTFSATSKLAKDFKNVSYHNFMDNTFFDESDFKDGDHLNAKGAEKFTLMLNKIINNNLN